MYLVDTDILSAGAPTKAQPAPELIAWMERNSDHLYLSVITVAEVEAGIAKARRHHASRKADRLAAWLEVLVHLYATRILPLNVAVARLLGRLSDQAHAAGQAPGLVDLTIAATATSRGYTVSTRNLRHFKWLAVPSHDPFDHLPAEAI